MTIRLMFGRADAACAFYSMADGFVESVKEDPESVSEGCRDPDQWQRFVAQMSPQLATAIIDDDSKELANGNRPHTMLVDDQFKELIKETYDACLDNIDMNPTMECDEHDLTIDENWVAPPRLTDDEKNAIAELIAAVELTGRHKRAPKLRAAVELAYRLLEG